MSVCMAWIWFCFLLTFLLSTSEIHPGRWPRSQPSPWWPSPSWTPAPCWQCPWHCPGWGPSLTPVVCCICRVVLSLFLSRMYGDTTVLVFVNSKITSLYFCGHRVSCSVLRQTTYPSITSKFSFYFQTEDVQQKSGQDVSGLVVPGVH